MIVFDPYAWIMAARALIKQQVMSDDAVRIWLEFTDAFFAQAMGKFVILQFLSFT